MNLEVDMYASKRIALVDDNSEYVNVLVSMLSLQGFDVHGFDDPVACLDYISSVKQDLLLSDYQMPEMSGLDLIRNVRQLFPDLPCILVTGYSSMDLTYLASAAGCASVVAKPFSMKFLTEVINRHIDKSVKHA